MMSELEWERGQHEVEIHVTTFIPPAKDKGFVSRLLSGLRARVPDFVPETFQVALLEEDSLDLEAGPVRPLTEETIPEFYECLRTNRIGSGNLNRGNPPEATFTVSTMHEGRTRYDLVGLSCPRSVVSSREGRGRFLAAAELLLGCSNGFFGDMGTEDLMMMGLPDPVLGRQVIPFRLESGLPPPRWGILLGAEYVALLGRDRLLRSPCEVVNVLRNGSFLLLLAEDFRVLEANPKLHQKRRNRLVEHFGQEYFSFTRKVPKRVLPQLERSSN